MRRSYADAAGDETVALVLDVHAELVDEAVTAQGKQGFDHQVHHFRDARRHVDEVVGLTGAAELLGEQGDLEQHPLPDQRPRDLE